MGIELVAACMPSEHASDRATAPGARDGEIVQNVDRSIVLTVASSRALKTIGNNNRYSHGIYR